MSRTIKQQHEDCAAREQRMEVRAEKTKERIEEWRDGDGALLLRTARERSWAAHRREFLAKSSLEHSLHTLGMHYSTHRQYNRAVNDKLCDVLQGCLETAPEPSVPDDFAKASPTFQKSRTKLLPFYQPAAAPMRFREGLAAHMKD